VTVGFARRRLSCFVITLSYSRALSLQFFFDQSLENFLEAHVEAFSAFGGAPRVILYDNLKPRCWPAAAMTCNSIRGCWNLRLTITSPLASAALPGAMKKDAWNARSQYIRSSFFAAWPFTTLEDFNRQARIWCEGVAAERMWVEDDSRTVGDVFREEQPRLLQLPAHRFESDLLIHPLGKNHLCPLRSQSMKTGSETAIAGDLKASQ
jgi:transposase